MSESILAALITGGVSLAGSVLSLFVSYSLTQYRIKQLEEKVSKLNNLVERMYHLEQDAALVKQRVENLERSNPE